MRKTGKKTLLRGSVIASIGMSAALALTACGGAGGSGQSGSAANEPKLPDVEVQAASYPSEGVEVSGLRGERVISSLGAAARWDSLPGSREFNEAVSNTVKAQLQVQAETKGASYTPEAHGVDSGLNERGCIAGTSFLPADQIASDHQLSPAAEGSTLSVVCDPVLAAGDNFGQRLRFVRAEDGAVTSDTVETIYTNTSTGDVAREAELLDSEQLPKLYEDVADKVAPLIGLHETDLLPASEGANLLRSNTSSVQFDDKGGVTVTVDANFLDSQLDHVIEVVAAQSQPEVNLSELPDPAAFSLYFVPELLPVYFTELAQDISKAKQEGTEWAGTKSEAPGKAYVDCDLNPCVALTFDDGPSEYTPSVLDALAGNDAAATFYLLGDNAAYFTDTVLRIKESGNELGNHSRSHPQLTALSLDNAMAQINETTAIIEEAAGEAPATVRPPYGDWNESILEGAQVPFIMWSIDTLDWTKPGDDALIDSVVYQSQPGDIVLMHDIHLTTTSVVPQMLPLLNDRGFTMVTIDQLFGGELSGPRVVYSRDD